jgi:predicted O-methyltransferase YrrM
LRNLVKKIPFVKLIIRFLKNLPNYLKLLESDNYRFISTFEPGHFYSPIPDYKEFIDNGMRLCDRSITEIKGINLKTQSQIELIKEFSKYYEKMPFAEQKSAGTRFWLDNGLFSYGDSVILYSFLRHFRPKRIIEVGSGFSSAAMLDVNDKFFDGKIEFDFIEPYPDRLYALLSEEDEAKYRTHVSKIQEVSLRIFSALSEDDILFIDSSHVAKAGSDLVYILSEILPRLNRGVILHFHDIFWPFEYPDEWFVDGRAWNEAYFLKVFLEFNEAFEIVYFNSQMETHYLKILEDNLPLTSRNPSNFPYTQGNTSLWLRKIG